MLASRHMLRRFQANFYNIFNKLQLLPVTNGNANAAANIQNQFFGIAQETVARQGDRRQSLICFRC